MFKALFGLLSLVIMVGVAVAVIWYFHSRNAVTIKAQEQAGRATVQAGQATAAMAAQRIIVAGGAREHLDLTVHQANTAAIANAAGADTAIPPAVIAATNAGLCRHAAFAADPACAPAVTK